MGWLSATLVLMAAAGTQPTLTLEVLPVDSAPTTHTVAVWLQAGAQPVEALEPLGIMPRVFAKDGTQVPWPDWRNEAGYAMPTVPPPPVAPLAAGGKRRVDLFHIIRTDKGYRLLAPYGGADLPPGTWRVEVSVTFNPTTREAWVARYQAAAGNPLGDGVAVPMDAEKEAARYAAHWKQVSTFYKGTLHASATVVLP